MPLRLLALNQSYAGLPPPDPLLRPITGLWIWFPTPRGPLWHLGTQEDGKTVLNSSPFPGVLGAQVLEKHSLHPRPHHFSPRETWLGTPISDCVLPPLSDVLAAGTPVSRKKCSLVPPAFRLPSESAPDTPAVQWKHRLTFHGRPPIGCSAADAV